MSATSTARRTPNQVRSWRLLRSRQLFFIHHGEKEPFFTKLFSSVYRPYPLSFLASLCPFIDLVLTLVTSECGERLAPSEKLENVERSTGTGMPRSTWSASSRSSSLLPRLCSVVSLPVLLLFLSLSFSLPLSLSLSIILPLLVSPYVLFPCLPQSLFLS